ncbi:hypothetical protein OG521_15135 [Streptomyces sp. NBC_01463]
MADEQYEWLDKEAAEKLLRREPVDPADGLPGQDAERLTAALDAAFRTARPATGELPGEAAALAAFRAAPRASRTTGAASTGPVRAAGADGDADDDAGMLAPVHIRAAGSGPVSRSAGSRGPRPMRWSRPIRFGLVASVACCAIGGVAAGAGMLPGPFGRHTPTPATSVSAAASPEELGSDLTADDDETSTPPGSPDEDTASPDTPGAGRTDGPDTGRPDAGGSTPREGGDDSGDSSAGHPSEGPADRPSDGSGTTQGPEDPQEGGGSSDDTGDQTAGWYAKTLKACRDYRDGKLDDERRDRLVALAKGARNLDRFCDRMLDKADGQGGGNQSGNDGEDRGDGDGSSGTLPSVDFSTASPQPSTSSGAPHSGTSGSPAPGLSLAVR